MAIFKSATSLFCLICLWSLSAHAAELPCDPLAAQITSYLQAQKDWSFVSLDDLHETDAAIWNDEHKDSCPGIAVGNFGQRKQFAVTLINKSSGKIAQRLVLLTPQAKSFKETMVVDAITVPAPMFIWVTPPDTYFDATSIQEINVTSQSLVFEQAEANAFQYFFVGGKLRKITVY